MRWGLAKFDGREGRASVTACNGRDARCPLCGGHDGIWPSEFDRILNGESANCGAALS